jgi:hypothetical protein
MSVLTSAKQARVAACSITDKMIEEKQKSGTAILQGFLCRSACINVCATSVLNCQQNYTLVLGYFHHEHLASEVLALILAWTSEFWRVNKSRSSANQKVVKAMNSAKIFF